MIIQIYSIAKDFTSLYIYIDSHLYLANTCESF